MLHFLQLCLRGFLELGMFDLESFDLPLKVMIKGLQLIDQRILLFHSPNNPLILPAPLLKQIDLLQLAMRFVVPFSKDALLCLIKLPHA